VNALLEAFGSLVSLAIFILVAWQLWVYANELATNNQTTWVVLWPMSPWYRIAALLMVLCIPVLTVVFFSQVKAALFPERDSDNKDSQPPVEAEESG
jgi:TRAP-type C4-dicarboxylate transport system permease small subunit